MGANYPFALALLAFATCLSFAEAGYGGTCNKYYDLNATTCWEVYESCGMFDTSCTSNDDGDIDFYCYDLGCSGTWTSVDACPSMQFSTCEEADAALMNIGCICSDCVADRGYIDVKCYHPFNCSLQVYAGYEYSDTNYGVLISVYSLVAGTLVFDALVISLCCCRKKSGQLSTRDVVRKKLSCVGSGIYRLVLASFVLENGSPMPFLDYVCDKRDLFGVIDCRKKRTNLRPRWMRLCAYVTNLLVILSVAFICGTQVYNNEVCSYSQDTCDGEDMAVSCIDSEGHTILEAYVVTTLLSLAVSEGSGLAVSSVTKGSLRQKLQLAATFLVAIGLVIYGVLDSNNLSKGEIGDDVNGDSRRQSAIELTLLVGWGVGELIGIALVPLRFLMCWACYYSVFQYRLEEEKKAAGSAAIHPQEGTKINDAIIESGHAAAKRSETAIQAAEEENPTSSPVDITPDSADDPKTTTDVQTPSGTPPVLPESADIVAEPTRPVVEPTRPAAVTSPRSKIGEGKSASRLDGGISMASRKKTLTENIKLEPPKRTERQ